MSDSNRRVDGPHLPDPTLLVDLGLRYLARRWGRAALTSLGVAAVIAVYLGISGGGGASVQGAQGTIEGIAGRIVVQQSLEGYSDADAFPALTSLLDASVAETILATLGADPRTSSSALFMPLTRVPSPGEPPAVLAVGIEPGHENAFLEGVPARDGRPTLSGATGAILGPRAARYYAEAEGFETLAPGAVLEIGGEEFEVLSLLEPGSALTDRSVLVPLATAQRLFFRPAVVSAVILHMEDPASAGATAEVLRQQFPDLQVIVGQEDAMPAAPGQEIGGEVGQFFDALRAMVLAVAVLMISVVMLINVADQRRQIGILRAMGAGRGLIAGLVLIQSVLLSVAGTVLAWPIYALITLALRTALAEANIEITVADLLPSWTRVFLTALLVGALASLWPAWQAGRVTPLEALRAE